ncbi:neurotrypsin-like, partial [Mercenaria mercenaria]|uniref:neurotrypsin-like n=1 Tax=Mercenaria mercenaria TaxID=6596 RepID=UPI00234EF77C
MVRKKLISIDMVFVVLLLHVLIGAAKGSGNLDISGIRLANGTGPFGGRVEVSINGVWGTVCDYSFDMNDANVMCRMINLKATAYVRGAYYGQGTGPIFAQEFKCNGNEQHIKDCEFVENVQCTHARDISIVCTECGEIDIYIGYAKSISKDGRVLSAACRLGFSTSVDTSVCEDGTWSIPSISCTEETPYIRLVNGTGLYDGRVEILVNGTWGTICSTSLSWQDTVTICRTLFGLTAWHRTFYTTSNVYGAGSGPIHLDNLDCDGLKTDLNECTYSLDVSCTDHSGDIAVACN